MNKEIENSIREKSLEILLNKYKVDIEKLKSENERLKKYESKFIGYLIILLSVIIFSLSVFIFITDIQFILVAFFSFALIGLVTFLIFIYSPKTYHLDLTNFTLRTISLNLNQALSTFPIEKFTVFLPVSEMVYQFIPFLSDSTPKKYPSPNELTKYVFKIQNKGIILEPIGANISEFIINEFKIKHLKNNLNKIEFLLQESLIDKLNLAKALNFTRLDKGQYKLVLTDNIFAQFCHIDKPNIKILTQIGCPICSFVAVLLAQITNRAILLKSYKFDRKENLSTVIFELGELYH